MRHTMTVTALTAALLVSTAAYADNMKVSSEASIKSLPSKGVVSLTGTVDRVVDGDTIILRDAAGDTIDVHTASNVTVEKGDMVSIKGDKTAELAGVGEEINNATLSVTDKVANLASPDGERTVAYDNKASLDSNVQARTAMKHAENTESPKVASDNTEMKKTAAYDLDVDADAERARITADVDKVADAGEMTAKEATALTTDTATRTVASADAEMNSTIEALPKEGAVELNGVVAEVDSDNSFTLRDAAGKTIDVKTASNVEVQPGDTVSVNGNLKSKLLGLGREIDSAKVLVVSAAD